MIAIKIISSYIKVRFFGIKEIKGYYYKEVETLPIVGNHCIKGYEIINGKTNKVLFRRIKDWGIISARGGSYRTDRYAIVSQFFSKNI